jgi:cytochrome d ubiquinol oxidase subunit I
MSTFGQVYGFPFMLEGFAFFVEAIFVGVYLYGWDRLTPRAHMLAALPMVAAGISGAFFVVAANSWMQTPSGFRMVEGKLTDPDPWAALFNPSAFSHGVHMIVAAVMVTGFCIASVYAVGMLRGRRDQYHRYGLLIPLTVASIAAPVQILVGDWIAGTVAAHQPGKLAALEALGTSQNGAPLSIGGIYTDGKLRWAIEIPRGLSLLVHHDPNGRIAGLDSIPADQQPPVNVTHLSYTLMVGIGTALAALAAWYGFVWWRRRDLPRTKWFLRAAAVAGVAAVLAMETGWTATEVGRQPWIVYHLMLTKDAVSTAPGLRYGFYAVAAIYTVLTVLTVYVLRRLARDHEEAAPQEHQLEGVPA